MIPDLAIPDTDLKIGETTLHLRADFAGLAAMEKALGASFLDGQAWINAINFQRMKPCISVVHSLSHTRHPDLTRAEVGALINMRTLPLVAASLKGAMQDQLVGEESPVVEKQNQTTGPVLVEASPEEA